MSKNWLFFHFNSRPCMRGDAPPTNHFPATIKFQFTPLHEGRRGEQLLSYSTPIEFQFTPLHEGRPSSSVSLSSFNLFQFTPLREGRPKYHTWNSSVGIISIHAPA